MAKHWHHTAIPLSDVQTVAERAALVDHLNLLGRSLELLRTAEKGLAGMRVHDFARVIVLPEGWAYLGRPIMFVRDCIEYFRLDIFEAHVEAA